MGSISYEAAVPLIRKAVLSSSPLAPMEHVMRCRYPAGLDCAYHSRNTQSSFHAILTLSGRMAFQEEGCEEAVCVPGTVVSIPRGSRIRWRVFRDAELLLCINRGFFLDQGHGSLATLFGPLQERLAAIDLGLELVESVERRLEASIASPAKDLMFSLACLEFMAAAVESAQGLSADESGRRGHSALSRCLNYIERNIDRDISLKELSSYACLGPSRLSQLFKERLGVSPLRHVAMRKADVAERLLAESGLNVGEVASRLGFNSISYFSRFYKRAKGRNPSEAIVR